MLEQGAQGRHIGVPMQMRDPYQVQSQFQHLGAMQKGLTFQQPTPAMMGVYPVIGQVQISHGALGQGIATKLMSQMAAMQAAFQAQQAKYQRQHTNYQGLLQHLAEAELALQQEQA